MRFGLTESLSSLVKAKFDVAKSNGSLLFSWTDLAIVRANGVPFQLRYCPALSKKPNWEKVPSREDPHTSIATLKKLDPFHEPSNTLLIAEIPAGHTTHILVLNKFPVVHNHFILATKDYKEQTHLLEQDDLAATIACLHEWEDSHNEDTRQKRLFAFFNSGRESGASQPHRHIQFLPLEDMAREPAAKDWSLLVENKALQSEDGRAKLPFTCLHASLSPDMAPKQVYKVYRDLYERAVLATKRYNSKRPDDAAEFLESEDGRAAISYNLALTTSSMMLCPRRREGATIHIVGVDAADSVVLGPINLNGTILAGTLMVKLQEEWDALRKDHSMLLRILEAVGIPPEATTGYVSGKL